ncbi:sugar kinase [Microbulbifer sp. 2201CG32-9]|uniref:sugar kinase n=1 Tax=Microbulbifer sp. 2201CG32-9 TaxID=3232309 RepID=UPI00345BCA09
MSDEASNPKLPRNPGSRVAIMGECMVELSLPQGLTSSARLAASFSYGGDTFNTALYMARLGGRVAYLTALGDDTISDWLLSQWQAERVDTALVERFPGSLPGLYAIETDDAGERCFHYWRNQAPVRQLFDDPDRRQRIFDRLADADVIYFTGISMSLFSDQSLQYWLDFLTHFKHSGGVIAFDSNYRPRQWPDPDRARQLFAQAYSLADIALPTLEDEALLYPGESSNSLMERLRAYDASELVVKQGVEGCTLFHADMQTQCPLENPVKALDTTAAGDSFNAGYLIGRLRGLDCVEAVSLGQQLAGTVVQHRGAIIPMASMPTATKQ